MNLSEIVNFQGALSVQGENASQYQSNYEADTNTLWGWFNPQGTPCFSLALLNDIRAHDSALESRNGYVNHNGQQAKVNYYVVGSRVPGIFNLGGFETALASDVLVAEENAQLGLPEILFNLFPGMGAYSLLSRRVGPRVAEEMITSGRIYSAAELHQMGIIDVLAKDGQGEAAARDWIERNQKRRNGFQAVMEARKVVSPVSREELDKISNVWVDAALRLEERDLKMINRLVRSQSRRIAAAPGSAPASPLRQIQEAVSA